MKYMSEINASKDVFFWKALTQTHTQTHTHTLTHMSVRIASVDVSERNALKHVSVRNAC
jgi:hypothetical protein